ncbi:MAG: respiratory nitrate reductase subunit gamma [Planctomycetota bacterium]|nr:MAG: respiratory nitrate reductase subunit gamma [Planctomycetota bacterium]
MNDFLLFAVVPYLAISCFLLVTIQRYRQRASSYSTLSSQFLENKRHFWGSVPFHYGLMAVLAFHFVGVVFPKAVLSWNSAPLRLYILEISGLALALLSLVGLLNLISRRLSSKKIRKVTTVGDLVVYLLLTVQIVSGIYVAVYSNWGSSWFASNASPWLWSLARLDPQVQYMAAMPLAVKIHVINAFLLIGFFPFTRLVHVLVVPNHYLWRRTQVVLWNYDRTKVRSGK